MRKKLIGITLLLCLVMGFVYFISKNSSRTEQQPSDGKSVEDYFVEHMRVSQEEARSMAENGVDLRVSKNATLLGIVGNLYSYGFVDSQDELIKLLETREDKTKAKPDSIKVGKDNSIDINSNYYLNYSMSDEEIADTLLNKAKFDPNFTQYDYLFMPSGPDQSRRTNLKGTYVCLPHRSTEGPITMECAFGLKADDGNHYALDTTKLDNSVRTSLQTGKRISVEGLLVPIEMISSDQWRRYAIEGIIQVDKLEII